jgi:RNA polymerase sigma factor (sigma-70 family)
MPRPAGRSKAAACASGRELEEHVHLPRFWCTQQAVSELEQLATHQAIQAVFRIESPRLIAGLARMVKDVGLAEELAQDALVTALEHWPETGVPDNPGAWLMATAKRRAIDELRRNKRWHEKQDALGYELETHAESAALDLDAALDDDVGDDLLRLVFTSCHPVLPTEARVALTLRLLGGLTTLEIARAFVVPEPTIAQRIVRAKRTLAESGVPFEVPRGPELQARLSSVLEVVYLIFNEGYSATTGEDWMRPALCEDALRLGRILATLAPNEPEVHGLVALMEIQASRLPARVAPSGEPILLLEQNRARWDRLLISRGLAALERAEALGGAGGPYALQAAIAACHARAATADATDWSRIAVLYYALSRVVPSPIVELNRAVAVGMAFGPAAGLAIVDALLGESSLASYHLLPSVRGDLLFKLARFDEAQLDFERAASLTRNARERELLLERARASERAASGS